MRLSFYSGLALAMIAADTAKAEAGAGRKETSLAQAANERIDEEQDGDWALAQELDHMCYDCMLSHNRGAYLDHGFCHFFPEHRRERPQGPQPAVISSILEILLGHAGKALLRAEYKLQTSSYTPSFYTPQRP